MSFTLLGILNSQAAGGAAAEPAFFHISTTTLASDQSTITISSIPTEYKHLQVRFTGRATTNANTPITGLRFGTSDVGYAGLVGDFNSLDLQQSYSTSTIFMHNAGRGYDQQSNCAIITILDYNNPNKRKTAHIMNTVCENAFGSQRTNLISGSSIATGAVTSFTFDGNGFDQGTEVALYGIVG